jgi:hypothetical protein
MSPQSDLAPQGKAPTCVYVGALPEFRACKFAAETIVTEGRNVGTVYNVCVNLICSVYHPKPETTVTMYLTPVRSNGPPSGLDMTLRL